MDEGPLGEPVESDHPGLPELIGKVPAAEQVDRWIRAKVLPSPPASVDSVATAVAGRVYVPISVTPRGGGPYRIVSTADPALNGRYYMRRGRESVEADHYYLRRLFADAEEGTGKVRTYLAQRGFGDEYDVSFANRDPARRMMPVLVSQNPNSYTGMDVDLAYEGGARHRCVAIAMPEILRGGIADATQRQLGDLLNAAKWKELQKVGSRQIPTLDGRALERTDTRAPQRLLSYLHVHRTSYVEGGRCDAGVVVEKQRPLFDAVRCLQSLQAVLGVAGRLQKLMETEDNWLVSLMLRETDGAELFAFTPWNESRGTSHVPGMRIEEIVSPAELDAPWAILRLFDTRLFNAFGIDRGRAVLQDSDQFHGLEPEF